MEARLHTGLMDPYSRTRLLGQLTAGLPAEAVLSAGLECEEELATATESAWVPDPPAVPRKCQYDDFYADLCQTNIDYPVDEPTLFEIKRRYSLATRAILLDWVCEVCADYGFRRETYYLTVSLVSRYLQRVEVGKSDLQLVAAAALSLAAKAEEASVPSLVQLCKSCNGAFSPREMKSMEHRVATELGWKVFVTTPVSIMHWLMARWDEFLAAKFSSVPEDSVPANCWPSFLSWNSFAVQRLQRAFWVLDAVQLDTHVQTHFSLHYTAAVLYLCVCHAFQTSDYALLGRVSESLVSPCHVVEDFFEEFLTGACGLDVKSLYREIEFLVPFLNLMTVCEFPAAINPAADEQERRNWTSRQSHFPFTLQYVSYLLKSP